MNSTADLIERLKKDLAIADADKQPILHFDSGEVREIITALSTVMPDEVTKCISYLESGVHRHVDNHYVADLLKRQERRIQQFQLICKDYEKQIAGQHENALMRIEEAKVLQQRIDELTKPVMPDEVAKRCDYLRKLAREFAKEANQKLTPEAVAEGVNRIPESTTVWKTADLLERLCRENNEQDVCLQLLKGECADYQSLCGRAFSILSEHWDSYTDPEGYGPTSLLRDLEHASKGQPHKDITLLNRELSRCVGELQQRIDELKLEVKTLSAKEVLANGEIDLRGKRIESLESQRDQLAEVLKEIKDFYSTEGAIAGEALERIMQARQS